VQSISPCSGGDINRAFRLELGDGRTVFLKARAGADPDEFRSEAAGLRWLTVPGGPAVAEPLAVVDGSGNAGLVLEWIEPGGPLTASGQERLGRGLARVHLARAEGHGVLAPGSPGPELRLGGVTLGTPADLGPETPFAAVYSARIEALTGQALAAGNLDRDGAGLLGRLSERMDELSGPPVETARLHGDLWGGNVITGRDGRPWLIDPVAYGGHPEVDLAMLRLFGTPGEAFLGAYRELNPPLEGHDERVGLWQVQPLLVHAVLFGGGYGSSAVAHAARYVGGSA
jgi:fructosamine-3-kinase